MDFPFHSITKTASETSSLGKALARKIIGIRKEGNVGEALILCLYGELGSGKTTFVQGFAKTFGLTRRLLSPTFIIVRRYDISKIYRSLIHIDLYRITSLKDIQGVGLMEMLSDHSAIILIEWADRLGKFLPKNRIDIRFSGNEDGSHQLWISQKTQ